jgi:hypothetical protein
LKGAHHGVLVHFISAVAAVASCAMGAIVGEASLNDRWLKQTAGEGGPTVLFGFGLFVILIKRCRHVDGNVQNRESRLLG